MSRKKNDNVHGNLVLGTPKSSLKSRGEVFSNASPRAPGCVLSGLGALGVVPGDLQPLPLCLYPLAGTGLLMTNLRP